MLSGDGTSSNNGCKLCKHTAIVLTHARKTAAHPHRIDDVEHRLAFVIIAALLAVREDR